MRAIHRYEQRTGFLQIVRAREGQDPFRPGKTSTSRSFKLGMMPKIGPSRQSKRTYALGPLLPSSQSSPTPVRSATKSYKGYRIRMLSQLQNSIWYPEALIMKDRGAASLGMPIFDKQTYLLKAEADPQTLKLVKRWVDQQKNEIRGDSK